MQTIRSCLQDEEGGNSEAIQSDDNGEESEESTDSSDDSDEDETQVEKDRKAAFFTDEAEPSEPHDSFPSMNLLRPILKALSSLGFAIPITAQAVTIPVALLGKDVLGKMAACIIPMIERLVYRERWKKAAATRCLIVVPTREVELIERLRSPWK